MIEHHAHAECLSSFRIDQLAARELAPGLERVARAHLAGCSRCRGRLEAVEQERGAFAAAPPAPIPPRIELGVRTAQRRAARRAWWLVAPALVAAVVIVWLARPRVQQESDAVRSKGAGHLELFVEHGGAIRAAGPGEVVAPGDRLQFAYSTTELQFLAIIGIDATGSAEVYYPSNDAAAAISIGEHVTLDRSIVLDDSVGTETIYGLFCARPTALAAVLDELRARGGRALEVSGCTVETLRIGKHAAE
jgi:hypothetical protein